MRTRKRVNLTLDEATYARLCAMRDAWGFASSCELVSALVHVLLDSVDGGRSSGQDMPEGDSKFIRDMFAGLADTTDVPDGNTPRYHRNGNRKA